ncbi:MAG: hypothetical protein CO093_02215 [Alphaproteobacteria bacterium CG_4_9_14_3_um_filter_47_13]|nr:MAG: hypothetical protein CO093_02215 [Alphaproteobacteria bacterium CG_4_9_14_3_um_filter_47_13]
MDTTTKYSRQTILAEIGSEGQEKLVNAKILCIGAGGLGCPALLYLAGAGIGTIGIVDFDKIEISNLQRQILFSVEDEGKSKAVAARERLYALNPDIEIKAYDEELTAENVLSLFSSYDVIIDGTDNFAAKFLINDAALKLGKLVVYGAIQGFDGQVSVFGEKEAPCYRCLHPQEPQSVIMNCAEAGVIGAVAGIIGTIQALETIKLIVGHEDFKPLSGRLWLCDTRTMDSRIITIPKKHDCPACAKAPEEIILQYSSPICTTTTAKEIICSDPLLKQAALIDVRELAEWEQGHIEGAYHLPLSALQINPEIYEPPQDKQCCILYCQKGMRSRKAAEILAQAGFTEIYSLRGGYEAWCQYQAD